ncbi:hypothetical protein QQ045_025764 [Rhodiola kirilowii]
MAKDMKNPPHSNLDNFLHSVTPSVPSSNLLPKSCIYDINSNRQPFRKENDYIETFTLGDLWQCYDEWSSYGVATPLVLDDGEILMQYFAPCLSALQICTNAPPLLSFRCPRDIRLESVLSFSDESENDKLSRSTSNNSSGWEASSDEYSSDFSTFSPSSVDKLGQVYMQYFEYTSPFTRIPFYDKIVELGRKYPGLMTLKNVELSPASWMAVAWYPIYHIPSHKTPKDLSTMFLTYHTLSSCFQDDEQLDNDSEAVERKTEKEGRVSLEPFGMASYRMAGDVWINQVDDYDKLMTLQSAADSWLKQLGSYHHDFNFFLTHSASVA